MTVPKFQTGERIGLFNFFTKKITKTGTINYLRNDSWEKKNNHPSGKFYYSVNYDDGSFETYQNESDLIKLDKN